MKNYQEDRRNFIKLLGLSGLGLLAAPSSILKLKTLAAAAADNSSMLLSGSYKALVCLYFDGGNDSFNMLVPRGAAYSDYATVRSNLALRQEDLVPISPDNNSISLGLHQNMGQVAQLFNNGKLSFISNIGMLIEPVSKERYNNESVQLPLGLFSHADQRNQWLTASQDRNIRGWAGKIADLMQDVNANKKISMNVSLHNTSIFQSGNRTVQFVINDNGAQGLIGYRNPWGLAPVRSSALDSILNHDYQDPFSNTYCSIFKTAVEANVAFDNAIKRLDPMQTPFEDDPLSRQLQMVARAIAARESLEFSRQIFFVRLGEFDTHSELLDTHARLMRYVNNALYSFQSAMEEIGVQDDVILFSMSEFGRTLSSNGNGTDHAWGGNAMVMGEPVNGKQIYGEYPDLALGTSLEIGGGTLIPTTATDAYFAELALWFGVAPSDLPLLFPNLHNFYDFGSNDLPLGFLTI